MPHTADTTILVVEDMQVVALDLQRKLTHRGYRVIGPVAYGEEAVQRAGAERPDLVLMDVLLQGPMHGIEAGQQILQLGIPVIYLTGMSDLDTFRAAMATSPSGYLLKPFSEHELHESIQRTLSGEPSRRPRSARHARS